MTVPGPVPRFDAPTYLAWEAGQTEKHEYFNGEVFAMARASEAHVTLAGNLFMALRYHLRGGLCSVFISSMKLQVEADNAFFYPDVFVTCAEFDRAHSHYKAAPSLVVEVLSPHHLGLRPRRQICRLPQTAQPARIRAGGHRAPEHRPVSARRQRSLGAVPLRSRAHGGICQRGAECAGGAFV